MESSRRVMHRPRKLIEVPGSSTPQLFLKFGEQEFCGFIVTENQQVVNVAQHVATSFRMEVQV